MKRFLGYGILLTMLILTVTATAVSADAPERTKQPETGRVIKMTLTDAVSLVLRSNRNIAIAYLDRLIQKYDLQVAEAEFLPNVRVDVSSSPQITDTHTTSEGDKSTVLKEYWDTGATFSARKKIVTGGEFAFSWENEYTSTRTKTDGSATAPYTSPSVWSIEFTQPLLKGGGIDYTQASLARARLQELENIISLRDNISNVIANTISAYNSFYQSSRNLKIRKTALEEAKKQLETNKILVETGRMASNELIQSESQVADQEFSYEEALNEVETKRLALLDLLDIDKTTRIIPDEDITIKERRPDYERCLKIALENNSTFITTVNSVKRSELALMEEENSRLWNLDLTAQYKEDYDDYMWKSDTDDDQEREWYVGLTLTAPFELYGYDRIVKRRKLLLAKKNLKVAQMNLKEAQNDLETQIQNAVRDVYTQIKLVKRARKSLELAKLKLEFEKTKLNVGRSTIFQVVSFQNTLVDKQEAELQQTISYLTSLITLDQLLGKTLETWSIELKGNYKEMERELIGHR
jgi:outer membrane protein TolC